MATEPLRLCVNCKHHEALSKETTQWCERQLVKRHETSVIDGRKIDRSYGTEQCRDERLYNGSNRCGPKGQFFEPKPVSYTHLTLPTNREV